MGRVALSVLGLSASHSQSGAYALILQEEEGLSRIPIIIGSAEAQAIAIALEGLKPPRPLTHDLFVNLSNAYSINLLEVEINKIEEGIFYAQLVFKGTDNKVIIDARTSDAVALAVRFQAPIYATTEVLRKAGIMMEEQKTSKSSEKKAKKPLSKAEQITLLKKQLKKAIKQENYEEASRIKNEIAKLK
jgi:bifunctional DNase/RNase